MQHCNIGAGVTPGVYRSNPFEQTWFPTKLLKVVFVKLKALQVLIIVIVLVQDGILHFGDCFESKHETAMPLLTLDTLPL